MSIKVKLRRKPISKGRESLYLDFYPPIPHPETKEPTRREFLNMYVAAKPKNTIEKQHDKETISRAEFMRQNRENELNKPEIYTGFENEQLRIKEIGSKSFFEYFRKNSNKREGKTKVTWDIALIHLQKFAGADIKFSEITEQWCLAFRDFLLTDKTFKGNQKLAINSARQYYSKLKTVLRQAYKDGYLQTDINVKLDNIPEEETRRHVLTIEEVNALISAECPTSVLKKAAIFSVFTGLRFSDIQKLTWGEIEDLGNDVAVIHFKQKKTRGIESLPISVQAIQFLGERKGPNEHVFEGLVYSAYYNVSLAKWIGLAGITKPITFHSFRHTFATLQLSLGTDIYTVSKMLGHRDLKTTQIYTRIIDASKREAANRINLNIKNWK